MATTFTAGSTVTLTLDSDDTVTWVGSGQATITPASGPAWGMNLEGNQTFGPFGQSVTVSVVTRTAGSYTQNGYFADRGAPVYAVPSPVTGGIGLTAGSTAIQLAPSGDATGVTDRVNMQSAIDSLPLYGGELRLSRGVFYLDSAVTISKTVKIEGAGGGIAGDGGTAISIAPTTINVVSATSDGFVVSANGCTFRDFALVNIAGSTPTSGAGILATANNTSAIDALTVVGFYNLLDLGGCYYSVTNCKLYDAVNFYLYMHAPSGPYYDHGDMIIANNVLSVWKSTGTSVAQLQWESGGGLKCIGNKFNSGTQVGNSSAGMAQYAIRLMIADGVTTGSLIFTGNSISGKTTNICNFYVGLLGPSKTGKITNLHVVGNEIPVGNQGITIEGDSAHDDAFRGFNIAENMFSTITTSSIKLRYVRQCRIGRNFHNSSVSGALIDIPDLASNILGLSVDKQHIGEITSKVVVRDNRSIGNLVTHLQGGVEYDYTHGVAIAANGVWTQVFKIEVPNQAAGSLDFEIDGRSTDTPNTSANRKGVVIRQSRSFDVSSTGVVTISAIGTDVAAGTGSAFVAVRYTVTTNWIAVEIQTSDATNCVLWGQARLKVNGKLQTFHIGV